MIATRSIATALSSGGRYALDVPVAALAGLSVAFLAFAAPADFLSDLVRSLGLSAVVPAAEPPLGVKARFGLGAAGAVAVFTIAFLLLRWLDRLGAEPREPAPAEAREPGAPETPRLRRRDFHPDAPPRPPILATWDLGEPNGAERKAAPAERVEPEESWAVDLRRQTIDREVTLAAAVATDEEDSEPAPSAGVEAPPVRSNEPSGSRDDGEPARSASPEAEPGSLTELMARLEQGLARRRQAPLSPAHSASPVESGSSADDRLQSAIESLQRLTSRQG